MLFEQLNLRNAYLNVALKEHVVSFQYDLMLNTGAHCQENDRRNWRKRGQCQFRF